METIKTSAKIVSVRCKLLFGLMYNLLCNVIMMKSHKIIVQAIDKMFSIIRMSK